ncbi:hypothetical protein MTR67_045278 [Solanum verrucosum]|uniref:Integrase zinc-binding domain-containing protein n=1 Tax=Solanum verrucosum TaxID=315347 RepID=A0AAF0URZ5_SOLVR|nr:hypothetical protein MTR67_045278 [Solanum verrucosum]
MVKGVRYREVATYRLARLGVRLMSISDGGVTVQSESSLVAKVKEKQDNDPILLQLKGAVHQQRVEVFSQGGDGATKMYRDLQEVFWWNGMKREIADFVAKCPNFQQVKEVEHHKSGARKEKKVKNPSSRTQQGSISSSSEIERFLRGIRHQVQVLSIQITHRSVPDLQFSSISGESSFFEDD